MMGYIYTQKNRLETPHGYMYSSFEGMEFLQAYFSDREGTIHRLGVSGLAFSVAGLGNSFRQALNPIIAASRNCGETRDAADLSQDALRRFSVDQEVVTRQLLESLVATQLAGSQGELVKAWLDRLSQRFEVSTKLFDSYLPGFRKGQGGTNQVGLYWLLALALCLFYIDTGRIKYLSTQLKITDLLCSLPIAVLGAEVPVAGVGMLIHTEITVVRQLLERKGVAFAS